MCRGRKKLQSPTRATIYYLLHDTARKPCFHPFPTPIDTEKKKLSPPSCHQHRPPIPPPRSPSPGLPLHARRHDFLVLSLHSCFPFSGGNEQKVNNNLLLPPQPLQSRTINQLASKNTSGDSVACIHIRLSSH